VKSDRDVPIRIQLSPDARTNLEDIERIVVSPAGVTPIVLRTVGRVAVSEGPAEIRREAQRRVAVVAAEVEGRDLGSAAAEVRMRLDGLEVPPGLAVQVAGSASDMQQAFSGLSFAIGLAILLVYLILAAQFESFLHPLIILGAVPLAGAGAVVGLAASGTPLSVVVLIGSVVLAGIVVNNSILLVDRINQLRRRGGDGPDSPTLLEAVEQAGRDDHHHDGPGPAADGAVRGRGGRAPQPARDHRGLRAPRLDAPDPARHPLHLRPARGGSR